MKVSVITDTSLLVYWIYLYLAINSHLQEIFSQHLVLLFTGIICTDITVITLELYAYSLLKLSAREG